MKTYKHLYPQITSYENLRLAFKAARKGKRAREDVATFEYNLEENLLNLQTKLENESYRPGKQVPHFDSRSRGDGTRTGMESPVLRYKVRWTRSQRGVTDSVPR